MFDGCQLSVISNLSKHFVILNVRSEEIQAQRLRELTERGFSLERAREALAAVGDGSIEEAQLAQFILTCWQ